MHELLLHHLEPVSTLTLLADSGEKSLYRVVFASLHTIV